jgi:hypothetical protein
MRRVIPITSLQGHGCGTFGNSVFTEIWTDFISWNEADHMTQNQKDHLAALVDLERAKAEYIKAEQALSVARDTEARLRREVDIEAALRQHTNEADEQPWGFHL